jgi:dTDP-4-dehydrorhamnose reductase
MKVTIFGANGMLGYAVSEYFKSIGYNVKKVSRKDFDIAKQPHEKIEDFVSDSDVAINCAGVIKPRIKDMSIEDVLTVNSLFPKNFAKICNKNNVKSFHITTDCVYSGKKGNYSEEDLFDADDLYGLSKAGGDYAETMVLRTSIIGEELNQSRSLLEWAKGQKGNEVLGFVNHAWNGVTTLQLAKIIETIINKDLYSQKLFHVFSPDYVTKFELLNIFNKVYELKLEIQPREADNAVDRRLVSLFDLGRTVSQTKIEQQVYELKDFFEQSKTGV